MRRIRYSVAASLDGYIAGPQGEYDWIIMDPDIDFSALVEEFDTVVMGRRSYEVVAGGGNGGYPGLKTIVVSRTLRQRDYPDVTILAEKPEGLFDAMLQRSGPFRIFYGHGRLVYQDDQQIAILRSEATVHT